MGSLSGLGSRNLQTVRLRNPRLQVRGSKKVCVNKELYNKSTLPSFHENTDSTDLNSWRCCRVTVLVGDLEGEREGDLE